MQVSIHAPGRGATSLLVLFVCLAPFQFTHPGGVRPEWRCHHRSWQDVSIHAPGRGATGAVKSWRACGGSFNSRTREGCDAVRPTPVLRPRPFQFTHPGGVRLRWVDVSIATLHVSIHAPGRGATSSSSFGGDTSPRFNSRTREGCDSCATSLCAASASFQFTHPGGVRPRHPQRVTNN